MAILLETLCYEPVELGFGTSGLRGLVSDMTDLECYINTRGFMEFLKRSSELKSGSTIYVAGDLRDSTPRIMGAVMRAIRDKGYVFEYCGLIPTPALAHVALRHNAPGIMVTGSHIPADRNGIKFYKIDGEILKEDEAAIKQVVSSERSSIMSGDAITGLFDKDGMLKEPYNLPIASNEAQDKYIQRFSQIFSGTALTGKKVVVYQHSAVGRDILPGILSGFGAEVVNVGRSDVFVPIDTENVTDSDKAYFKELAEQNQGVFAIVSTDGDSDRPFVIDEDGTFHRGDELGAVVAKWLGADFAAVPISSSDAVTQYMDDNDISLELTKIGSPHVISAMNAARAQGSDKVVGWEVNGGFLLGSDFNIRGNLLTALPTRDAFLPILIALISAAEQNKTVSALFTELPSRFTQAGLVDNVSVDISQAIIRNLEGDSLKNKETLEKVFDTSLGFAKVERINSLDGIRIFFSNGDIAHLRPSGNAPQLRVYSISDTQDRADEIVRLVIAEPDGILRRLQVEILGSAE